VVESDGRSGSTPASCARSARSGKERPPEIDMTTGIYEKYRRPPTDIAAPAATVVVFLSPAVNNWA
jgi:hypothetical protein